MADIKENGKGAYEVIICHHDELVPTRYVVTLIPDTKTMSFSTALIKQGRNNVIGDLRRKIDHEARRELMSYLREALTYKKGRKRVSKEERLARPDSVRQRQKAANRRHAQFCGTSAR